jgi:hypothetical protein
MNKKRRFCLFLIVLCSQMQACIQVKKKGSGENKQNPSAEGKETVSTLPVAIEENHKYFKTRLEGSDQPGEYKLHVQLISPTNWPLRVQRAGAEKIETKDLPSTTTEWQEEDLRSGEQVRFDIGFVVQGRFQIAETLLFKIPLDFEFPEKLVLDENGLKSLPFKIEKRAGKSWLVLGGYERVFFPKNSETLILNQNIEIKTKFIYFDRSVIATFPEGSKALVGKDGRSGGQLRFEAEQATGQLRVELRGEDGGDGLPGDPPDHRNRGVDRPSHVAPSFTYSTLPCYDSSYCVGLQTTYRCTSPVPLGMDADPGKQGHPGKPGRHGGNSGKLDFQFRSFESLDLLVLNEVGRGGLGGEGGEGGEPGKPGLAWRPPGNTVDCSAMVDGRPGARGVPGFPGNPGMDGRIEMSCYPRDGKINCINKF